MEWRDLTKVSPLKLNIGGSHQHHPRRKWRGYVSVGLGVPNGADAWTLSVKLPATFELPDGCVDTVLSEHFIEHLTATDAIEVLAEIRRVIKPGGRFRVAVPDMLHPKYQTSLQAGRDLTNVLHLSIWTYETLSVALLRAGFARLDLQHYWDMQGVFHERPINFQRHGYVKRCPTNDRRNRRRNEFGDVRVTSLIIDAFAPKGGGRVVRHLDGEAKHCPTWNR